MAGVRHNFILPQPLVPYDATPEQMRRAAEAMVREFPMEFHTDEVMAAMAVIMRAASAAGSKEFSSGVRDRQITPGDDGDMVFCRGAIEFEWWEYHRYEEKREGKA